MAEPNDPEELFIVLHKSGRPASAWSEQADATDAAAGWNAHVICYVPAAELDRIHAAIGGRASHGPKGDADCAIEWIAEVKEELTAARERVAELEVELYALRTAHANCDTASTACHSLETVTTAVLATMGETTVADPFEKEARELVAKLGPLHEAPLAEALRAAAERGWSEGRLSGVFKDSRPNPYNKPAQESK